MNYYDHHIGDYAEATAHLTFVEDAAYSRLIRKYYATEKPIPADLKAAQRLVGARTKEEKIAVQTVLEEFFSLSDDGWHQTRCDHDIEKYLAGEPEREVKKANEDNRLKKHREERARLFKVVTDAGLHAAWNIGINELRELAKSVSDSYQPPLPATAPATPATATQAPDTNHQPPVLKPKAEDNDDATVPDYADGPLVAPLPMRESPPLSDDPAIQLAVALRRLGVNAPFTHPAVQDWATKGASIAMLTEAVAIARQSKGDGPIPPNYLVPIVRDLLNPPPAAAAPAGRPRGPTPHGPSLAEQNAINNAEAKRLLGFDNDDGRTIDAT